MGLYTGHDPLSWVKQLIGDKDERKPWRASSWSNAPLSSSPSPEGLVQAEPRKAPAGDHGPAVPTPSSFAPKPGGLLDEVGPGPGGGSDPDGGPSPSMSMSDAVGRGGMSGLEAAGRGAMVLGSVVPNPITGPPSPLSMLGLFTSAQHHGKAFEAAKAGKEAQGKLDALSDTFANAPAFSPEEAVSNLEGLEALHGQPAPMSIDIGPVESTLGQKGSQMDPGAMKGVTGEEGGTFGGSSTGSGDFGSDAGYGGEGDLGALGPAPPGPEGTTYGGTSAGAGSGGSSGGVSAMGPSAGAAHGPSGHGAGAGGGGGGGK